MCIVPCVPAHANTRVPACLFLVQESVDFSYAMIIDDDVPLPPDLHVPLHTLSRQDEIKAVSYVICAATEKGHYNSLVALQDAEYMMAVRNRKRCHWSLVWSV